MDKGRQIRPELDQVVVSQVVANQVRLALFVLAYNLGNFMSRLALPEAMKHCR